MGKTNKHISETEKRRDHPVNPTDVEYRGDENERRPDEGKEPDVKDRPLISRDPGKLLEE